MKKSIFSFLAFILLCGYALGQNLSPNKGFYPIQKTTRKMTQLAKNKMLMQGQEMTMVTNMNMYSIINIQRPVSDSQKISITYNKIEGDIEVMGKKQNIPDASISLPQSEQPSIFLWKISSIARLKEPVYGPTT